ncbi:MAG: polymer-forming cytoskeletal protein [Hyphomicrobiaceae bacterium]
MFSPRKAETPPPTNDSDRLANKGQSAPPQAVSVATRSKEANYSIINEWLKMTGDLESEGDILVKGKIFGNIKCNLLIVDTDALVEGGIEADEVVVRGQTKGTINANRVRLEKTANVDSEICHKTFSAEEGARIKGALKFLDDPLAAAPAAAKAKSVSVAAE